MADDEEVDVTSSDSRKLLQQTRWTKRFELADYVQQRKRNPVDDLGSSSKYEKIN